MPAKKEWPVEFTTDYWDFVLKLETIKELIERIISSGFEGQRAFPYLKHGIPNVEISARNLVLDVADVDQRRRSGEGPMRWPYYAGGLLASIEERAEYIGDWTKEATEYLQKGDYTLAETKIRSCLYAVNKMIVEMKKVTVRRAALSEATPADEAAEIVDKLTADWAIAPERD